MVLKWAILVNFHCSEILGTLMVHIEQQHRNIEELLQQAATKAQLELPTLFSKNLLSFSGSWDTNLVWIYQIFRPRPVSIYGKIGLVYFAPGKGVKPKDYFVSKADKYSRLLRYCTAREYSPGFSLVCTAKVKPC